MQLTCNHRFEPGLSATIKVKETNVFLQQFEIKRGTKMVNFKDVKKRK
jgi:hypothetical protein